MTILSLTRIVTTNRPGGVLILANRSIIYIMQQFTQYLKATVSEMKQVKWPTTHQTFVYSLLVIGISAVVALFLGAFDYIFNQAVQIIISTIY